MPKNKVQFQKGLSLRAFFDLYGSDAQCEQAPIRVRWPHRLLCVARGPASFCRLPRCNRCKR